MVRDVVPLLANELLIAANDAVTVLTPGDICPVGGVPAVTLGSFKVLTNVAVPLANTGAVPIVCVPTLKVTIPPVAFPLQFVTVATNVTSSLYCLGFGETVTVVVVVTLAIFTTVVQLLVLLQPSVAVHTIVLLPKPSDTPAKEPVPLKVVAPVIE